MNQAHSQFVLASSSPRRRQLLEKLGFMFEVWTVDFDETINADEAGFDYVKRMSRGKALAAQQVMANMRDPKIEQLPIITADTIALLDRQILGKPKDVEHAKQMLAALAGTTHTIISSVTVCDQQQQLHATSVSQVRFRQLSANEINGYCATGEGLDKAGAYALQGRAAAFVERIEGSYSGIVGLPLSETVELLKHFNIHLYTD